MPDRTGPPNGMIAADTPLNTPTESIALQELKTFLNKLFQFESQDLDFGIYKILHYKRHEIRQFIDKLLVEQVNQQLQTLSDTQATEARKELTQLEQAQSIAGWLGAKATGNEAIVLFFEQQYAADIRKYHDLETVVRTAKAASDAERQIYNHLTIFFSRYYDKGDFVSKRRFGKNEKYVVPYNGEETHFYWANHDQYYIKSAEHFQQFAFKTSHPTGTLVVNFKLADAQTEQGNVKADDNKYFVPAHREPELTPAPVSGEEGNAVLNLFFEHRALTETEKKTLGSNNKQDKLNEQTAQTLETSLKNEYVTANLWQTDDTGTSLLLRKLNHYTRTNKYDFFIHKDLCGFLRRELDFYIKAELLAVDDLYVLDTDLHFERIRHSFKTIKVFKALADTLIELMGQIEEFQKKLWEKKKFVLRTDWIITLDKLVGWLGPDAATPLLTEALQNPAQRAEWLFLFGPDAVPFCHPGAGESLTINDLKLPAPEKKQGEIFADEAPDQWRKLPIDTAHFAPDFKDRLLTALSDRVDVETVADGLVLHTDNFHGLMALQEKYREQIKCIYIDPPYNTDASEIIYKNGFRSSSWVSLIDSRLALSKDFLREEGILCATIDDFQQKELSLLIEKEFSRGGISGTVIIRNNPSGRPTQTGFALAHEYGIFARKSEKGIIGRTERSDEQLGRFSESDEKGVYELRNLRREGSNSEREKRRKLYYPIYVNSKNFRIPRLRWNNISASWIAEEEPDDNESVIFPIDDNGIERTWRWGIEKVNNEKSEVLVKTIRSGKLGVYVKYRPNEEGAVTPTVWTDSKYSATEHGTGWLKKLFSNPVFSYPKSLYAVQDSLDIMGMREDGTTVLDYFPGSGTTFHATQLLNRDDEGSRKCILVEQGSYVYTVILPRIKKVAYTFDWKDGRPKDDSMNGLGVFLKYQRLEQYEESLENIAFTAPPEATQLAIGFGDYIPKYFLEFETRNSQTLVNTAAMLNPWAYELKVWDGFTYDTRQAVDLVETFCYLIGLHLQKNIVRPVNNRHGTPQRYQFVQGRTNAGRQVLAVWRNVTAWQQADYEADLVALTAALPGFTYDVLYVNHQALVAGYQPIETVFATQMIG